MFLPLTKLLKVVYSLAIDIDNTGTILPDSHLRPRPLSASCWRIDDTRVQLLDIVVYCSALRWAVSTNIYLDLLDLYGTM